jgi:hypothetical protein
MQTPIGSHLAGFLLSSDSAALARRDLDTLKSLKEVGEMHHGWLIYEYITKEPIPDVDLYGPSSPNRYQLIFRWGRTSLLALARNFRIIQHLIANEIQPLAIGAIRQNEIRVHNLVLHMMANDISPISSPQKAGTGYPDFFHSKYTLSRVGARTDAFGEDLRNLQFYGERISKATLFQESAPLMRFYSCTLRREGSDIVKLGRDGFVSFKLPSLESGTGVRLREVNEILRALTDQGFIF